MLLDKMLMQFLACLKFLHRIRFGGQYLEPLALFNKWRVLFVVFNPSSHSKQQYIACQAMH